VAGKGPPPAENSQRTEKRGGTKQLAGAAAKAPPLVGSYLYQTIAWYQTWAESDNASQFSALDWQRLQMLAPLVDLYFANPTKDLMAEIRQNESKLGATAEDRQRLRWKPKAPEKPEDEKRPSPSRARKDPRA
jgi:hypothetical protein